MAYEDDEMRAAVQQAADSRRLVERTMAQVIAAERPHAKLAADAWRLIQSLQGAGDDEAEETAMAVNVIEMACDAAAKAAKP